MTADSDHYGQLLQVLIASVTSVRH